MIVVKEGESISKTITFDDFDVSPGLVLNWKIDLLEVTGTADSSDFSISREFGQHGLELTFEALLDIDEDPSEKVEIEFGGWIEFADPSRPQVPEDPETPPEPYTNIFGLPVHGSKTIRHVYETATITIQDSQEGKTLPVRIALSFLGEGQFFEFDEGGSNAVIHVRLSYPSSTDILIVPKLSHPELEADLSLQSLLVPAGATNLILPLGSAKAGDGAEREIESGSVSFSVQPVGSQPNLQDYSIISGQTLAFNIRDEMIPGDGSVPDEVKKGLTAGALLSNTNNAFEAIYTFIDTLDGKLSKELWLKNVGRTLQALDLAVDALEIANELEASLSKARSDYVNSNKGILAQTHMANATYDAHLKAEIEFNDRVAEAVFTYVAVGIAEYALLAGLSGVAGVAALPMVGAVVVGAAAVYAYDGVVKSYVREITKENFEEKNSRSDLINHSIQVLQAQPTLEKEQIFLPDMSLQLRGLPGDFDGDTISGFDEDDKLVFLNTHFLQDSLTVEMGSAILKIDTDLDDVTDTIVTLTGDFEGVSFSVDGAGDHTEIKIDGVNAVPTGLLEIRGKSNVGETLFANMDLIQDEDGIDASTVSFQWIRDGLDISGAYGSSYFLSTEDEGSSISVRVTFRDNNGHVENVAAKPTDLVAGTTGAYIKAATSYDLTAQNLSAMFTNDSFVNLIQDRTFYVDGFRFDGDHFGVTWAEDTGLYSRAFFGHGIEYPNKVVTSGTIQVLQQYNVFDDDPSSSYLLRYEHAWYIRNLNLSAVDIFNAARTGGSSDDDNIFAIMLAGNDAFHLSSLDDYARGFGGNDYFFNSFGDDVHDGGVGTDTAVYSGSQKNYTLTFGSESVMVKDRRPDGSGLDKLVDIELIDFETDLLGSAFDLRKFGGSSGLDEVEFESFIEFYIAYFNRAPDAVGLNFWGTAFANGTTLEEMATLFIDQDETRATYPEGTSNSVFATSVYDNVLGRLPDQAGINFWVGLLDSGEVSRDQFILEVLRGAKSELKPELGQDFVDQQIADKEFLSHKIDIGAYFAVHKGMSDVDNAIAAMELFDGSEASIQSAVDAINGFYSDALHPTEGEFLMPLIGVLDDPFAIA